jgi:hypothetical protein
MEVLQAAPAHVGGEGSSKRKHYYTYFIRESTDTMYLPGRCADVFLLVDGKEKKSMSPDYLFFRETMRLQRRGYDGLMEEKKEYSEVIQREREKERERVCV